MASDDDLDPKQIDWAKKDEFRKDFGRRSSYAFVFLCFGIGVLALAIPIVLPLVGGFKESLSAFYHGANTRDLLVGMLCANGVFLILFQGLSRWENLLLSLAGVFLILVALVPGAPGECRDSSLSWHSGFAGAFFICLFIVAIFFSKSRLDYILWPPLRRRYKLLYNIAGVAMIVLPATSYLAHVLGGRTCSDYVYWVEAGAIGAFSMYWFTKTSEYKRLLGVDLRKAIRAILE